MSTLFSNLTQFEADISAVLVRAAQLARKDAIRTNTDIVIRKDGKIVEVSAAELKQQALIEKEAAKN